MTLLATSSRFGMPLVTRDSCKLYKWMERLERELLEAERLEREVLELESQPTFVAPVRLTARVVEYCHDRTFAQSTVRLLSTHAPFDKLYDIVIQTGTDENERAKVRSFLYNDTLEIALLLFSGHQRIVYKQGDRLKLIDPYGTHELFTDDDLDMLRNAGFVSLDLEVRESEQGEGHTCVSISLARAMYMIARKYAREGVFQGQGVRDVMDRADYSVTAHEPIPCAFVYFTARLVQFVNREGFASIELQRKHEKKAQTIALLRRLDPSFPDDVSMINKLLLHHIMNHLPDQLIPHLFSERILTLPATEFAVCLRAMSDIRNSVKQQLSRGETPFLHRLDGALQEFMVRFVGSEPFQLRAYGLLCAVTNKMSDGRSECFRLCAQLIDFLPDTFYALVDAINVCVSARMELESMIDAIRTYMIFDSIGLTNLSEDQDVEYPISTRVQRALMRFTQENEQITQHIIPLKKCLMAWFPIPIITEEGDCQFTPHFNVTEPENYDILYHRGNDILHSLEGVSSAVKELVSPAIESTTHKLYWYLVLAFLRNDISIEFTAEERSQYTALFSMKLDDLCAYLQTDNDFCEIPELATAIRVLPSPVIQWWRLAQEKRRRCRTEPYCWQGIPRLAAE